MKTPRGEKRVAQNRAKQRLEDREKYKGDQKRPLKKARKGRGNNIHYINSPSHKFPIIPLIAP